MSIDATLTDLSAGRGRQKKLLAFGTRSDFHCWQALTSKSSRISLPSALRFFNQNLSHQLSTCVFYRSISLMICQSELVAGANIC